MASSRFNPRPAFQPGEAGATATTTLTYVLFQSTPGFSAGRSDERAGQVATVGIVSIHARLFSRAKLALACRRRARRACFNPRPAFQPGEAHTCTATASRRACFNPRPAFQPGEALLYQLIDEITIFPNKTRIEKIYLIYML